MIRVLSCVLCLVASGTTSTAVGTASPTQNGRHFYVSASGDDQASGRSAARAWRTVARVNRADLRPGDQVSFRSGGAYSDTPLAPRASGRKGARIVFDSYGAGRATLGGGVVVSEVAWITFERFRISGPAEGVGSGGGSGARHIDVLDNEISNVERGINSPNPADQDWLIADNVIEHTGDSGVIVQGSSFSIVGNVIHDTGRDARIPYGKHGIYSKSAHVRIFNNVITGFSAEGVSTRFPDAEIIDNVIRGGESGIAYYRDSASAGATTTICGNTISGVRDGVYIGPEGRAGATDEHFRVVRNVILSTTGRAVHAPADEDKVEATKNASVHADPGERPQRRAGPCPDTQ